MPIVQFNTHKPEYIHNMQALTTGLKYVRHNEMINTENSSCKTVNRLITYLLVKFRVSASVCPL